MSLVNEAESYVRRTYFFMGGKIISTVISMIGTIIVIRLLDPKDYGLLNVAFIIPFLLILAAELGLNNASIHYIAKYRKERNFSEIKNIIKLNILTKIVLSMFFSLLVFYFSDAIAYFVFDVKDPRLSLLIKIASVGIIANTIFDAALSIFIGYERMEYVSMTLILQSTLRSVISPTLIILGFGVIGPMIGYVFAALMATLFNLFIIFTRLYPYKIKSAEPFFSTFKEMIKYGLPLSIVSIITGLRTQIFNFILTRKATLDEVGFFNITIALSAIMLLFVRPISLTLFPAFSRYSWEKKEERIFLIEYFHRSIKYSSLFLVPVSLMITIFSKEIIFLVYGPNYINAYKFVSIYFLTYILISVGLLTIPNFLNGQGKTIIVFYGELIRLLAGASLAYLLVISIGGVGVVVGLLVGSIVGQIYFIIWVYRKYGKELLVNFYESMKIILTAGVSCFIALYTYSLIFEVLIFLQPVFSVFLGLLFSSLIYLISFLILGAAMYIVSPEELIFLKSLFSKIKPVGVIAIFIMAIEQKLVERMHKKS
ncbi:MAG: oligosaccharide flippase family protein [Candidatus Asgardarchaeum sp.]